jgi:hypothetical protein
MLVLILRLCNGRFKVYAVADGYVSRIKISTGNGNLLHTQMVILRFIVIYKLLKVKLVITLSTIHRTVFEVEMFPKQLIVVKGKYCIVGK